MFKVAEIILVCVRWYCKYGITYRDPAEMMQERGVDVDASTIFRWVQCYVPELEKRVRWYQEYRSRTTHRPGYGHRPARSDVTEFSGVWAYNPRTG